MPYRIIIIEETQTDCSQTCKLIKGISVEALLAKRGYDSDAIIASALTEGVEVAVPPKRNRKE